MEDGLNKSIDNTGEEIAPNWTFFPQSLCFHWSRSSWERAVSRGGSLLRSPRTSGRAPRDALGGDRREGRVRGSTSDAGLLPRGRRGPAPRSLGRSVPAPGQQLKQGTEQRDSPRRVR